MFVKPLYSEQGSSIIQVLAALLIVSAAIAGLFISSYYVQYKAKAHYHYRVALLKATEQLERIKWDNRANLHSVSLAEADAGEFTIDDYGDELVTGTLSISKRTSRDLAVATYVSYDAVTVKVTWLNGPEREFYKVINTPQEIELREDYFYRTDILEGQ